MAQLQASYFIDGIKNLFLQDKNKHKVTDLLRQLSFFELETNADLKHTNMDSILCRFNNLLTRGLPTRPSCFIEDMIANTFSKTTKEITAQNDIVYNFTTDDFKRIIYQALHIVEPRFDKKYFTKYTYDTKDEKVLLQKYFVLDILPLYYGDYLIQMIDFGRTYKNIIENHENNFEDIDRLTKNASYNFLYEKTSFSIESPFTERDYKGIIINLEDDADNNFSDYKAEELKNKLLKSVNWDAYIGLKKDSFQNIEKDLELLSYFLSDDYFENIQKFFKTPLYKTEDGRQALQIALAPLAIARIHKTLIEFILANKLNIDQEQWNIAVIEQDIPCGFLAIEDFKLYFKNFAIIENAQRKLPKINLTIYHSEEFEQAELNVLYQGEKYLISDFESSRYFDLIVDVSVLRRNGIDFKYLNNSAKYYAQIRSARGQKSRRKFLINNQLTKYQDLYSTPDNQISEQRISSVTDSITFFLRTIFRKYELSNNELEFVLSALGLNNCLVSSAFSQNRNFIALFVNFFQNAITMVIPANMSALKEYIDEMKNQGIDSIYYVNRLQTKMLEKQKVLNNLKNKEILVILISAEMFLTQEFRNVLNEMKQNNLTFSSAIINEAHSISEWGHDFSMAHSSLIRNLQTYCKPTNLTHLPLYIFSSYCSYNVIYDITNKLDNNLKILHDKNNFNNLDFQFVDIKIENPEELSDSTMLENAVKIYKQQRLFNFIEEKITNDNNLLVVCTEQQGLTSVSTKTGDGIYDKLENAKNLSLAKFEGTIDDGFFAVSEIKSYNSYRDYRSFKNKEKNILIASQSIRVALNMQGINNLVHLHLPLSVEHFIQTNARAGRQIDNALITTFFNNQEADINLLNIIFDKIHLTAEKNVFIFEELINEISYSTETPINNLKEHLDYEFDDIFELRTEPGTNPHQLHILKTEKLIGFIDFKSNEIVIKSSVYDKEMNERILYFAKNDIETKRQSETDLVTWLETTTKKENSKGMKTLLQEMTLNAENTLTVGFTNDYVERIAKKIKASIWENFEDSQLNNFYKLSNNFNEFQELLLKRNELNLSKFTRDNYNQVVDLYNRCRNFYQTWSVVHKMWLINIIDDYTINYHKSEITIYFTKREDIFYYNSLQNYLKLYITEEKLKTMMSELSDIEADSMLEKSFIFFNTFWYQNIVAKRRDSLVSMQNLVATQIKNPNLSENGYSKNKDYICSLHNDYFDAKYLFGLRNISVVNNEVIDYYIKELSYFKDNLSHLYKTTDILLKENPNNAICQILNGFADILYNSDNEQIVSDGLSKINAGYSMMQMTTHANSEIVDRDKNYLLEKIYEKNSSIKSKFEDFIELKYHVEWLRQFNANFLKGFKIKQ